jgi:hypothetical protein
MEGSTEDTMVGTAQIGGVATVEVFHETQRLRQRSDSRDASKAIRAQLLSAAVEVLAEAGINPSYPSLAESEDAPAAP